jgi:hypothetical protein
MKVAMAAAKHVPGQTVAEHRRSDRCPLYRAGREMRRTTGGLIDLGQRPAMGICITYTLGIA